MKKINKIYSAIAVIVTVVLLISFSSQTLAQVEEVSIDPALQAFRQYIDVDNLSISVPTVVEVSLGGVSLQRNTALVVDNLTNTYLPSYFKQEVRANTVPVAVSARGSYGSASVGERNMMDGSGLTFADFPLPLQDEVGNVAIELTGSKAITSSSLSISLANNVALPTTIEIRAITSSGEKIVVARRLLGGQVINFPQTTASQWIITFDYTQPLRISELRLNQENATVSSANAIRFLAQPDSSYRLYFDADRDVRVSVGEAGNLSSNLEVLSVATSASAPNVLYKEADVDGDSIADVRDNCVLVFNPLQEDVNQNGRGDACDDFDKDGLINSKDNCPNVPNRNQIDVDSDGIGDVCDEEESRITEKYPWLPWVGIGFAGVVLISLFSITALSMRKKKLEAEITPTIDTEENSSSDVEPPQQ